eukprot:TRINITY_DN4989_c0_g1_i4.p1 TRINITY_DN4989_c0_g1~~TRINITY_DN4989_c0_g1_i4.p1  ORF type:complete len:934 (-),score=128.08 TRINITY_DN4989_c0_g1_i4:159-2960(-)
MTLRGFLALFLIRGCTPVEAQSNSSEQTDCQHGYWDGQLERCTCYEGWKAAGITDTIHFLQGTCSQYECESDAQCEAQLSIAGASCMVRGWNCYCGWWYAFADGLTGFETTPKQGGAKCMGVLYTFSMWASRMLESLLAQLWKFFVPFAVLLLPFGRKRAICDHHRPSLWNGLRSLVGRQPRCRGTCLQRTGYNWDAFQDDFAWSFYVLDVMAWAYVFAIAFYVVVLFIWSVVLWACVILTLLAVCIVGALSACGEAASCDCACCGSCHSFDAGCCDCLLMNGFQHSAPQADLMYYGGNFPYDPFWGYNGMPMYSASDGQCCCCDCRLVCFPIAWLCYTFPRLPENAWGGLLGHYYGTHQSTPPERMYSGGNPVVEFLRMGWRRRADLHDDSEWREQVYNVLMGETEQRDVEQQQPRSGQPPESHTHLLAETGGSVIQIRRANGNAHARKVERSFDLVHDQCVPSSFEDYANNRCWICQDSNDEWDLWLSCHHLFCAKCSSEMLGRSMPCPLCRVASSTVLRGWPLLPDGSLSEPRVQPPPALELPQVYSGSSTTPLGSAPAEPNPRAGPALGPPPVRPAHQTPLQGASPQASPPQQAVMPPPPAVSPRSQMPDRPTPPTAVTPTPSGPRPTPGMVEMTGRDVTSTVREDASSVPAEPHVLAGPRAVAGAVASVGEPRDAQTLPTSPSEVSGSQQAAAPASAAAAAPQSSVQPQRALAGDFRTITAAAWESVYKKFHKPPTERVSRHEGTQSGMEAERAKFAKLLEEAPPRAVKMVVSQLFEVSIQDPKSENFLLPIKQAARRLLDDSASEEAVSEPQKLDFAQVLADADPEKVKLAACHLLNELPLDDCAQMLQPFESSACHLPPPQAIVPASAVVASASLLAHKSAAELQRARAGDFRTISAAAWESVYKKFPQPNRPLRTAHAALREGSS